MEWDSYLKLQPLQAAASQHPGVTGELHGLDVRFLPLTQTYVRFKCMLQPFIHSFILSPVIGVIKSFLFSLFLSFC